MEGTEADWWEMLTDYMEDTDMEQLQLSREQPNQQLHDGQVQTNSLDSTGDTTEGLHTTSTEGQLTAPRALEMDLDNRNVLQAGIEMQSHEAGKEESKDEI